MEEKKVTYLWLSHSSLQAPPKKDWRTDLCHLIANWSFLPSIKMKEPQFLIVAFLMKPTSQLNVYYNPSGTNPECKLCEDMSKLYWHYPTHNNQFILNQTIGLWVHTTIVMAFKGYIADKVHVRDRFCRSTASTTGSKTGLWSTKLSVIGSYWYHTEKKAYNIINSRE